MSGDGEAHETLLVVRGKRCVDGSVRQYGSVASGTSLGF
jgi:hypothetical protein